MDLRQSRHGCAEIKRGPEGPRQRACDTGVRGSSQRPEWRYFFSPVVSLTEVDPVAVGAPWGAAAGAA
jgi:hypothetical protein